MNIKKILKSQNNQLFEEHYTEIKQTWSETFVNYFEESLFETVKNSFGKVDFRRKKIFKTLVRDNKES